MSPPPAASPSAPPPPPATPPPLTLPTSDLLRGALLAALPAGLDPNYVSIALDDQSGYATIRIVGSPSLTAATLVGQVCEPDTLAAVGSALGAAAGPTCTAPPSVEYSVANAPTPPPSPTSPPPTPPPAKSPLPPTTTPLPPPSPLPDGISDLPTAGSAQTAGAGIAGFLETVPRGTQIAVFGGCLAIVLFCALCIGCQCFMRRKGRLDIVGRRTSIVDPMSSGKSKAKGKSVRPNNAWSSMDSMDVYPSPRLHRGNEPPGWSASGGVPVQVRGGGSKGKTAMQAGALTSGAPSNLPPPPKSNRRLSTARRKEMAVVPVDGTGTPAASTPDTSAERPVKGRVSFRRDPRSAKARDAGAGTSGPQMQAPTARDLSRQHLANKSAKSTKGRQYASSSGDGGGFFFGAPNSRDAARFGREARAPSGDGQALPFVRGPTAADTTKPGTRGRDRGARPRADSALKLLRAASGKSSGATAAAAAETARMRGSRNPMPPLMRAGTLKLPSGSEGSFDSPRTPRCDGSDGNASTMFSTKL